MPDVEEIRLRLEAAAEDLADAALDVLRRAAEGEADPTDERRITRARRAVERAVHLLGGAEDAEGGDWP